MGALDGLKFSNTYAYEALLGWRGVHIEASPQSYKVGEGGAATGSVPCATIGGGLGLETLGLATASSCSLVAPLSGGVSMSVHARAAGPFKVPSVAHCPAQWQLPPPPS
jgi:outer membrane lipoprotein SlyB